VIGNTDGGVFFHLRASRILLLEIKKQRLLQVDHALLDFLLEGYALMAISSTLTLHTNLPIDRYIPEDEFLSSDSLQSLNERSRYRGQLLGSAHELFGLIMPIMRSARYFMCHQNARLKNTMLRYYEQKIHAWVFIESSSTTCGVAESSSYKFAGQMFQQALLIFLYTTFNGANVPPPELLAKVDSILNYIAELAQQMPPGASVRTPLSWPARIVGSVSSSLESTPA
jgi:hypothetical protein